MILVLLLMSLFINIKVTIAMTLFLLSLAIIFKFMLLDRMNSLGRKRINIEGRWFRLVFSILSAMKDIRIMGLEDNICKQHDSLVKDNARISAEFLAMQATPRLTVELVFICVATFAMAGMVLLKMNIATYVATITMLAILFTRMIPSIHKLYNAINAYRYYELSVMALYDMHSLLASNQVIHSTSDIPLVFNYDITLNNVVCRYSNQPEPALKDISVRIIKESFVAVVGHSGSGKSTFLDLLSGLIEPESGEILIDGREVTKDNLGTIRSLMGYVPQKVTLIEGSIGYNIALDENYMNHRESINKAVQEAQIDSFINGLPEGMEYSVGETGSSMSGGQRQRIGIARALYKDPLILLLDEASSGLDPKTEKQFMDSIWKLRKSKTVIFATHKLDNIIDFDNIIVLDKGRMVDSGTHYELLSRCNIYIEMYWTASKS
jgi:ATP-binding cassette subfamily C protein